MAKTRFINEAAFNAVKRALAEPDATVTTVGRKLGRSWDTVNNIKAAETFEHYRPKQKQRTTAVQSQKSLIAQLRAEQRRINDQFDNVIATLERVG